MSNSLCEPTLDFSPPRGIILPMSDYFIEAEACRRFIAGVWTAMGVPRADAATWAELMVETSLLGFDSHGVRMLDRYVRFAEGGGIDIKAKPEVIADKDATAVIDAHATFGHLSAFLATQIAIDKARRYGISCVTVRNGNHVGACSLYVRRAAASGCIGICSTVSRSGMAPWGGKKALLGLDPIAVCAPIEGKADFLLDMATSVTAMGKVTMMADAGKEIPATWATDSEGNPTTDPQEAIKGTLLPIGGHKGYGLAMALEILASALGGANFSPGIRSWIQQTEKPMEAGFMIICIDIARFQDQKGFRERLADWVDLLTTSPRKDGVDRIYYPGEIEAEKLAERSRIGIPLEKETVDVFLALAEKHGMEKPEYL